MIYGTALKSIHGKTVYGETVKVVGVNTTSTDPSSDAAQIDKLLAIAGNQLLTDGMYRQTKEVAESGD